MLECDQSLLFIYLYYFQESTEIQISSEKEQFV